MIGALLVKLLDVLAPLGWWAVVALAVLLGAKQMDVWHAEDAAEKAETVAAQAVQDKQRILATYAEAAASAAADNAAKSARILADQGEAANEAQRQTNRARTDAAGAAGAAVGLRDAARTAAARCRGGAGNPSAVASGASAAAIGVALFPDLLGEMADAGGKLAAALDQSRIAGRLCEQSYGALK
jgi:hypothetical protein